MEPKQFLSMEIYGNRTLCFEWAATENLAKYPENLNATLEWPCGACSFGAITPNHDSEMVERLFG